MYLRKNKELIIVRMMFILLQIKAQRKLVLKS